MLKSLAEHKKEKLGKPEICAAIAEQTSLPLRSVGKMFDAYHECIINAVAENHTVAIRGFGTYSAVYRKEQFGRNPNTGEEIMMPECVMPKFRFGSTFKRVLAETFNKLMRNVHETG